jgi:methylated-DNA-[protein]-cysteine S-methyltransferase
LFISTEMRSYSISTATSPFGPLHIVWTNKKNKIIIDRILLPNEAHLAAEYYGQQTLNADHPSTSTITEYTDRIRRFLQGEAVEFDPGILDFSRCSDFQQKVLLAEHGIPRGWISTYGRIARHLGTPRAARAVGRALATNPFPIIIPCHRAVRGNGELGGYRGGMAMKRKLLEMEGVQLSPSGKVITDHIYYY